MGYCGWCFQSLYRSVLHITALLTNKNPGLALEVVVKGKIFEVNKRRKESSAETTGQTGGKALLLLFFKFCPIFNPSVLNSQNDYWEVWSNGKYKLDSKIKGKHENSEASKHLRETKIFPMQSSHTVSCVIAANPVQVTRGRGGVGWGGVCCVCVGGGKQKRGRLPASSNDPPPCTHTHTHFSFDCADPVSRHIAGDTKQISALG